MSYQEAKQKYAAIGVDTDAAIARLKTVPISLTAGRATTFAASTPTPISP